MRAWRGGVVLTRVHARCLRVAAAYCGTQASVDEVLAALARLDTAAPTTTTSAAAVASVAASPVRGAATARPTRRRATTPRSKTGSAADARRGERARARIARVRRHRLTQQVRDVNDELTLLRREQAQRLVDVARAAIVPDGRSAVTHLSSNELTCEHAPQHFCDDADTSATTTKLPRLTQCGCAAVVSLVGKVTRKPEHDACATAASAQLDAREVPVTVLEVAYTLPFVQRAVTSSVCVCCYGASLSQFARDSVAVGDVVHVLGHLLGSTTTKAIDSAAPSTTDATHRTVICVLPVGGNVSVVLSHTMATEKEGTT